MLSRRDVLRMGLVAGAAGTLPLGRLAAIGAEAHAAGAMAGHGIQPALSGRLAAAVAQAAFQATLPIPPRLQPVSQDATTDYYEIEMRPAVVQIVPGLNTTIWGYNGLYPGPTIVATEGRRVVVRQTNHLSVDTVVHLHGGHTAPEHDGHPLDIIAPGQARDYIYANAQPGCTLWYHDHANMLTGQNVYRGLAGFYLLTGKDEAALNLPSGQFDIPLVVQDRQLAADGSLVYSGSLGGVVGNIIVVNGVMQPRVDVLRRKYRLRFLNGSNYREYDLTFPAPVTVRQIASDGGLLFKPFPRTSITLAPAERVEVVVDFSAVPVGSQLVLGNALGTGTTAQVMRFDVVGNALDTSTVPNSLRPMEQFGTASVVRDFDLQFENGAWLISHKGFDPNRFDARPKLGSTEIWRFTDRSGDMHPMHLHLTQFKVLSHSAAPTPPWELLGLKDTVAVRARDTVTLLVPFTTYTGRYVFHCHRLEHEDRDMMSQFLVVP